MRAFFVSLPAARRLPATRTTCSSFAFAACQQIRASPQWLEQVRQAFVVNFMHQGEEQCFIDRT
jgi:hypothetical protein